MPGALRSVWHLLALIPLSKSSTCLGPPTGPQALEGQVGPACLGTFPRCHTGGSGHVDHHDWVDRGHPGQRGVRVQFIVRGPKTLPPMAHGQRQPCPGSPTPLAPAPPWAAPPPPRERGRDAEPRPVAWRSTMLAGPACFLNVCAKLWDTRAHQAPRSHVPGAASAREPTAAAGAGGREYLSLAPGVLLRESSC